MSNPGDARAASDAAGEEAGTGSAESTSMSCEALVIGMFFDGTNNSRDHVGTGNVNWHTNVDLLHHIYAENPPEEALINGQRLRVTFQKEYMRGIAVEPDGSTITVNGGAGVAGIGVEGVAYRVDEAVELVNQNLPGWIAGKEICNIAFDVFGFSRGAAAARYFANRVKDGAITAGGDAEVSIRFLGVFDTVSSIGFSGNPGNWQDVRLNTTDFPNTTKFQIIADDEIRVNFPICEIYGRQVRLVGSHSDIGGGRYPPGSSGHLLYSPALGGDLHEFIVDRWGFRGEDGYTRSSNGAGDALIARDLLALRAPRAGDQFTFRWQSKHGLQFVSMRVMHDFAVAAGIPFTDPLPSTIANVSTALDSTLQTYYDSVRENGVCTIPGFEDRVRREYAQFSSGNLNPTNTPMVTGGRPGTKL